MDIDNPVDLVAFLRMSPPAPTRTLAFLEQSGIAGRLLAAEPDPLELTLLITGFVHMSN